MKLGRKYKKELFYSIKDNLVELGPRRIVEYYEKTNLGITVPGLYEKSLLEIEYTKAIMHDLHIPLPVEILEMQHNIAQDTIYHLEDQRMIFSDLIEDSTLSPSDIIVARQYLNDKHDECLLLFKKYLIDDSDE